MHIAIVSDGQASKSFVQALLFEGRKSNVLSSVVSTACVGDRLRTHSKGACPVRVEGLGWCSFGERGGRGDGCNKD